MTLRTRAPLAILALALALPGCVKRRDHVTLLPDPVPAVTIRDPDRVVLDSSVANRFVKAQTRGEILARIHVATQGESDVARPPANVALVMDTSASMKGEAIEEAKKAALTLVDALTDGDTLALVVFGSRTEILVPAGPLDATSRARLRKAIDRIQAHGTTDLAGGLAAGLGEIAKGRSTGGELLHRVVLLSDGVPNDEAPIHALASQAAAIPAPITAFGLGLEYHETLLAQLSQTSGGKFHFVEDASTVATVFADEVLELDRVVAQSVQLRLQPGPGVGILEVVGHSPSVSGRGSTVMLGDLHEGQAHDVLVRLSVGEHKPGATVELLDAELWFQDATKHPGHAFERRRFLAVEATDDDDALASGRDESLERIAARMQTAAATLQIMALARAGQMSQAKAELARARKHAKAEARRIDDPELSRMAADLAELEDTLPELAPQPAAAPTPVASPAGVVPMAAAPPRSEPGSVGVGPSPEDAARHNKSTHSRAYRMVHGR